MMRWLCRPIAAILLLLSAALWAAPVGAVCSHAAVTEADTAAAEHQHHATTATTTVQPTPAEEPSSCPMVQGQANCTAQAPLPNRFNSHQVVPNDEPAVHPPIALNLPRGELSSIFHPPKA